MTVAEMIEWLKTQDQEAIVRVVKHSNRDSYYMQGGSVEEIDFDPNPGPDTYDGTFQYTDFRDNPFVKPDAPHYNQRFLLLGRVEE